MSSTSTRAEADRLAREVDAGEVVARRGGVALGVDEVHGGEHRVQAVGELGAAGHAVGGVVVAQLALGPDDALGERRLGDEEGPGDLGRVEPAEQPQRQRDLGVGGERRVAAQEHQSELVVGDDVDEGVEVVELGVVIGSGSMSSRRGAGGRRGGGRCGSILGGAGRWRGCGRSW